MTHPDTQSDRAVNDILSSIRQIISEDAEEDHKSLPRVPDERSFKPADPVSRDCYSGSGEQVLELTRLVKEDGSIVNLAQQEQRSDPVPHQTPDSHEELNSPVFPTPSIEKTSIEQNTSLMHSRHTQEMQTAFQGVSAMMPSEQSFQKSDSIMDTGINASPKEDVVGSQDSSELMKRNQEKLLSEEALQESAAAFAALRRATQKAVFQEQQYPTIETAGHYTVDNLMRELLRPLLKEWLDAHLPSLVRTLVVEQIEKVLQHHEATHS